MTLFKYKRSKPQEFRLVKEKNQVLNMDIIFLILSTLPFIKGEVIGENCLAPSAPDNHISVLTKCESIKIVYFWKILVRKT